MKYLFDRTVEKQRELAAKFTPKEGPADVYYHHSKSFAIYRPHQIKQDSYPTLFYIPGNAFVAPEQAYTHYICSHIAEQARCQVIVAKHKLAPEHQFPEGLNDTCQILKIVLQHPFFKIDKQRFAIAGYSSGGNFAALIAIKAKQEKLPISRQILISPITDLSRTLPGFKAEESKDPLLPENFVNWFLNLYIPMNINPKKGAISPYWKHTSDLTGLPITDIMVGEFDRFRGDTEYYFDKLKKAGNTIQKLVFANENHGLLWHNQAVIQTISSRLALSFATLPMPKELHFSNNLPLTIIRIDNKQECVEDIRDRHRTKYLRNH